MLFTFFAIIFMMLFLIYFSLLAAITPFRYDAMPLLRDAAITMLMPRADIFAFRFFARHFHAAIAFRHIIVFFARLPPRYYFRFSRDFMPLLRCCCLFADIDAADDADFDCFSFAAFLFSFSSPWRRFSLAATFAAALFSRPGHYTPLLSHDTLFTYTITRR